MRVCSSHFVDGQPTFQNPYPVLNIGYNADEKLKKLNPESSRRKLEFKSSTPRPTKKQKTSFQEAINKPSTNKSTTITAKSLNSENLQNNLNNNSSLTNDNILLNNASTSLPNQQPITDILFNTHPSIPQQSPQRNFTFDSSAVFGEPSNKESSTSMDDLEIGTPFEEDTSNFCLNATSFFDNNSKLQEENYKLQQEIILLRQQNNILSLTLSETLSNMNFLKNKMKTKTNVITKLKNEHNKCKQPLYEKLLSSDKSCDFYTGIKSIEEFNILHASVAPFVKRRWRGLKKTSTAIIRKYKSNSKSFGPKRKLCSKDEFLMMLMKF